MRHLRTRAQFQHLLRSAAVARTTHFALHRASCITDAPATATSAVPPMPAVGAVWLGAMTPKRWARRAVTRNAIRRQIYNVAEQLSPPLQADTAYLVRLRAGFARERFPSASSSALRQAVRQELQQLYARGAP